MQGLLERLTAAALERREPDRGDAIALLRTSDDEIQAVVAAAYEVRREFFGKRVKLNFLLNLKSGLCPEDCHYCSQRRDSTAETDGVPLVLSKPKSDWGNRVAELARLIVDTSTAKVRKPKRGFLLGRPR